MNTSHDAPCTLCPRRCGTVRPGGVCGMPAEPVISRAAPHFWEEPCISGERGSGAVFFAGCNLRCVFCQNYDISALRRGQTVTVERLRDIFAELTAQGVHNINIVTGTHYTDAIREALMPAPTIPVVWNCGGYESVDTLQTLEGKVQVYLPDMKYSDGELAGTLSGAPDYPAVAKAAIREMFRQTGPYELDENGLLTRGVMVRHLVLPGELDNTFGVLDWLAETFRPGDILVSLMGQYTPNGHGGPERRLTEEEYRRAVDYMEALGLLEGYTQELSSAEAAYTPPFDLTGV
ncbi:MAG: radical SAM protein [Oscillospiraceae bacterium]